MHYIVLLLPSSYFYEEFYFLSNDQWKLLKLFPELTDSITIGETPYLNIKSTDTYGKQGMQGYISNTGQDTGMILIHTDSVFKLSNADMRSHEKPAITLV